MHGAGDRHRELGDAVPGDARAEGLRGGARAVATRLTLDCRPFDIAMGVSEVDAAVYSPAVLRP
jgi:hypothetical protein